METRSSRFLAQCAERLFTTDQPLAEAGDKLRYCDWLLGAMWRQLAAMAGPEGARSLFGQAVLEATPDWPLLDEMRLTDAGLDTSPLHKPGSAVDREAWTSTCMAVARHCLSLIMAIAGETLVCTVVDGVGSDLRGLGRWLDASRQPDESEEDGPSQKDRPFPQDHAVLLESKMLLLPTSGRVGRFQPPRAGRGRWL
ncbi:MAG: hypothetical protein HYX94_08850 [Chloroflexi bacterium]|nr:hypothetical protein [Chloroflexota bacterium]